MRLPGRATRASRCSARSASISTLAVSCGGCQNEVVQTACSSRSAARCTERRPQLVVLALGEHQPAQPVAVRHGAPGDQRGHLGGAHPFELAARREQHRPPQVEPHEYGAIALLAKHFRVRLAGARGHAPVDRAQVVTGLDRAATRRIRHRDPCTATDGRPTVTTRTRGAVSWMASPAARNRTRSASSTRAGDCVVRAADSAIRALRSSRAACRRSRPACGRKLRLRSRR